LPAVPLERPASRKSPQDRHREQHRQQNESPGAHVGIGTTEELIAALPTIELFTVSVAVSVWLPPVWSVALKVPVPFVSVEFAGSVARGSLLVKWTVPLDGPDFGGKVSTELPEGQRRGA
jgi:hypothetical protein